MNFEAVVGLELHIQMKTKSKMFSSAPVTFGSEPNTETVPFDLAFPGTMPVVNKQAVINAIRVCHALHMRIDDELWFDRKNYFYSDLPKGYQITQERRPIGSNGYLDINSQRIGVERLHIEEDTCKQVHFKDHTLLDYNRAGIPLVEIVTKPEIQSGEEAMRFVEKIRSIVSFLGVSDGKMEQGSLRCDVNVSIRPIGSQRFGTKVEIKNINTLANIQRAIDYEIKRQVCILLSGGEVKQETRRFDERKKETVLMRDKTDIVDYKCFTETNIPPIKLSSEFINDVINSSPELAEVKCQRYKKLGLNDKDWEQLTADKDISEYFDEMINSGADPKLSANWIIVDVQTILNKQNISIREFPIKPETLAELIKLIQNEKVYNKQARDIFNKMLKDNIDPRSLVDINELTEEQIMEIVNRVINANPKSVIDYKNGKDKALGFLVGKVFKETNNKANPDKISKLVIKELKVR